ncbi:PREDICTED: uncharacterized protein LOC109114096 [Nelumbo nucifera]|uniref:Uncharacterized protein LOC109114096 n=1 Tax=Nelumbo nucifera TaxID=4432 RepID=A0A1U8PYV8_NELNU|nr:PREDICTED: uncharacterized protein LOC109114096 [Nelumbo nucifera]
MAHGQLAKLLDNNKLKEPNYVDWYHNLNLVLTFEKLDKVAKNPTPKRPEDKDSEAYNAIQRQFDKIEICKDILDSLKTMYEEQNHSNCQNVLKLLMTIQMNESQHVHDHTM